ncbi:acyl carrier protein [Streptosporangium sp. NPDC006007]|uniref:acyl carrier protein n=1 Tax=Streptosporangium sp. NPDC006007 TaxID=3154575 RepID=UPI0033B4D0EF
MGELRKILLALGVKDDEITADRRLRAHLALDSTETVELEQELHRRFGVVVDLWDKHDFTVAELAGRIEHARAHGTKGATGAGATEQD